MVRFDVVSVECLVMGEGGGKTSPHFQQRSRVDFLAATVSAFVWIVPVVASKAVGEIELTGGPVLFGV